MQIEIVSDAICPWCWIGKRHLEAALAELALEGLHFDVEWRPFQLNPDMPAAGVERASYRAQKFGSVERGRQLDAQVAQAGRAAGLDFRHDLMLRTPNTIAAHRLIRAAGDADVQDAMVEALFAAYFERGQDIGDAAVLADVAASAGMDRDAVLALLAGEEGRAAVVAEDAAARNAGLSGVPSFLMQAGGQRHLLFSGAVPADRMAATFRQAHAILAARQSAAAE